jgi:hypothetical protein
VRVEYHGAVANEVHLGVFAHDRLQVANGSIPHGLALSAVTLRKSPLTLARELLALALYHQK